ncbi:T9SS type A sorting domain-containing protein [Odoribacter sp. OttesenSCG-928-L07]|nr:T9SS type A sorting domain-containing protein [Odoribacter sp. OttesenSCG-928-L07]
MKKNVIKTKILLSIMIIPLLFSNHIFAQDGYDEGTSWHYGAMVEIFLSGTHYTHQLLAIDGDTIINEETFQRMYKNDLGFDFQSPYNVEYIKKTDSKVLWYNQETGDVSILYDFAAEAGDSWEILISHCSLTIVVDSVTYSDYNGIVKKNLYITDYFLNGSYSFEGRFFKGKVIEDIGHTVAYFPNDGFYYTMCDEILDLGRWSTGIRCYEDNDLFYNFNNYPCDTLWVVPFGGVNEYDKNDYKVYPNPTTNILTIEAQDNVDIIVTDIVGKKIVEMYNCNSVYNLDTSKWHNGIYFINIYSKGQKIITERVIKSDKY